MILFSIMICQIQTIIMKKRNMISTEVPLAKGVKQGTTKKIKEKEIGY